VLPNPILLLLLNLDLLLLLNPVLIHVLLSKSVVAWPLAGYSLFSPSQGTVIIVHL
jgi:hypothetical protein